MRGLLVPPTEEPLVVSKRDWNAPHSITDRLNCQKARRLPLPPDIASHMALFIDDDERLDAESVNVAITALLAPWTPRQLHRGAALFMGLDSAPGIFTDLSLVSIWRLGAKLVSAQHKQLAS